MMENIKDYEIKKARMNNQLIDYLGKNEKITHTVLEQFIKKYFKTCNRSVYYNLMSIYNDILKNDLNLDIQFDSKKYVDDCVVVNDYNFFSQYEIQAICDSFSNAQDKLIVYAIFKGIMGKEYQDLRNIKVSDVAEDYSYIKLKDRTVICDDYLKKALEDTIESYVYQTLGNGTYSYYNFNMESEYVLKSRCTKNNNNGLNAITKCTIQQKFIKLTNAYNEEFDDKINLSGRNLYKSGIMYDMYLKEIYNGVQWTTTKVQNYITLENLNMNSSELYRTYANVYHGVNVLDR